MSLRDLVSPRRRALTSAFFAALLAAGMPASLSAQTTYRMLVPVPAGNGVDVVARALANSAKGSLAGSIVIDNRPGAAGRIAMDVFKRSPADGSTVLFAPIVIPVLNPLVVKQLNYNPAKDLLPIAQVARYEIALAVSTRHPARTMAEFVVWTRAHPKQANLGSPGDGTLPHLLGLMLSRAAAMETTHVPYKDISPLLVDLTNGDLAAGISGLAELLPFQKEGKIRILATSGPTRSRLMPEVPTMLELGYAGVEAVGWGGLFAPAGTPRAEIQKWHAAVVAALRTPELQAVMTALDLESTGTSPEEFAAIIARDTAHWREVIRVTGFAAQ